jgi:queuine tRNA-ribosyltransferase
MSYLSEATIRKHRIKFPIYLPDATRAVVRSLESGDLRQCQTEAVVVNTFHLLFEPGLEILKKFGGVGKLMNFNGLIVSDSGGFQIMSLVHQKKINGEINENGLQFAWRFGGKDRKIIFTPESSIQAQFAINSDIKVALDFFTDPQSGEKEQERSVAYTLEWAERSKAEFERQIKKRKLSEKDRPWLMGVIQGGSSRKRRQSCAQKLLKIGFDLYGYGGWPLDSQGKFDNKLFAFNASLTPDNKPRFALGVGKPEDIALGRKLGYQFFDCVLPTRDARHGRLYLDSKRYLYISRQAFATDPKPIDKKCHCYTCQNYSRAYLHHLFKIKDSLYWRLSTIHNLYFYNLYVKSLL